MPSAMFYGMIHQIAYRSFHNNKKCKKVQKVVVRHPSKYNRNEECARHCSAAHISLSGLIVILSNHPKRK